MKSGQRLPRRVAARVAGDGTLTARVVAGRGLRTDVTLATPAGSTLERGAGRATATLCGQRDVRVVVRATAGSGRFTLVVTLP